MAPKPDLHNPSSGDFLSDLLIWTAGGLFFGGLMGCLVFVVGVIWWGISPTPGSFWGTVLICGLILAAFFAAGSVIRQMTR